MHQAFILGAGLGTRLRPLTGRLPKPLVPLFHRPLVEWTLTACQAVGIQRFAVNTHHLPEEWQVWLQSTAGPGVSAPSFFHEPSLLETGGGLKNIESWIGGQPLLVHNGDIFSTLPLDRLIAAHQASGLPATLALRSQGAEKRIALDASGTRVTDVRHELGRARGTHVFTGIYCINPEFLERIPAGRAIPVIPAFLELAARGQLGAVVIDEGLWLDLGDRDSYLSAHQLSGFGPAIHPEARVEAGALVVDSVIGPGAVVQAGAVVRKSVVWPGGRVAGDARLDRCIVFSGTSVSGQHHSADL